MRKKMTLTDASVTEGEQTYQIDPAKPKYLICFPKLLFLHHFSFYPCMFLVLRIGWWLQISWIKCSSCPHPHILSTLHICLFPLPLPSYCTVSTRDPGESTRCGKATVMLSALITSVMSMCQHFSSENDSRQNHAAIFPNSNKSHNIFANGKAFELWTISNLSPNQN